MKLYATINSERGKEVHKSGNEYLDLDITVKHGVGIVSLAKLTVRYVDDLEAYDTEEEGSGYVLFDEDDNAIKWYKP